MFFCYQYYVNTIYKPGWVIKVILLLWGWLVSSVPVSIHRPATTEANGCSYPTLQVFAVRASNACFNVKPSWQLDHPVAMQESQTGKKGNKGLEKPILWESKDQEESLWMVEKNKLMVWQDACADLCYSSISSGCNARRKDPLLMFVHP